MAAQLHNLVQNLRRAAAGEGPTGASDAELLDQFIKGRNESAFELLVWRHGYMVLGVCGRLLRDEQAGEDAFQAAFLALARRARSIGRRESVGAWLYKVAFRAALRARSRAGRRAQREVPLAEGAAVSGGPDPFSEAARRELRLALDEEISRLPNSYREAFVLCCLAEKSAAEAARELNCPVGTVESRLARARERLRAALGRRGFRLGTAACLAGLGRDVPASVNAPLVTATVKAATAFAAETAAAASAPAALAQGVLQSMFPSKLKMASLVALTLCGLGAGTVGLAFPGPGSDRSDVAAQAGPSAGSPDARADTPVPEGNEKRADEKRDQLQKADDEARRGAEEEARRQAEELRAARERAEKQAQEAIAQRRRAEELALQLRDAEKVARQLAEDALVQREKAEKQRQVAEQRAQELQDELRSAQAEAARFRALSERRRGEIDCNLKAVDIEKQTVSVTLRGTTLALDAIPISKGAKFIRGDKECALADLAKLKSGTPAALRVETKEERSVVVLIRIE
jgi:RNA polymerase sigma factor (sigma-70 family)